MTTKVILAINCAAEEGSRQSDSGLFSSLLCLLDAFITPGSGRDVAGGPYEGHQAMQLINTPKQPIHCNGITNDMAKSASGESRSYHTEKTVLRETSGLSKFGKSGGSQWLETQVPEPGTGFKPYLCQRQPLRAPPVSSFLYTTGTRAVRPERVVAMLLQYRLRAT